MIELDEDDLAALEYWWCPDTGEPVEVCTCENCAAVRARENGACTCGLGRQIYPKHHAPDCPVARLAT